MNQKKEIIAVCGLNCAKCDIFEASNNSEIAQSISDCEGFPCEKLVEWSKKDERYTEALNHLKEMKKEL
ncbi:MAG: hypothetical protein E3J87_10975 [Candidatus Cloacimonadota bacterium]|nr:MAG: hypothetical protein E3J87_10975 [Candidatus Cloacimonadota bacterium]